MYFVDSSISGRQKLLTLLVIIWTTASAQLDRQPPWQLTYQISPDPNNGSPLQYQQHLLPQQPIIQQQTQSQQLKQQQPSPPPSPPSAFINPAAINAYQLPTDTTKSTTQQPPSANQPQPHIPNPQVQSSSHIPQEVSLQGLPYFQQQGFQQQLFNFQQFPTSQEPLFEPKLSSEYNPFVAPAPLPPPPQLAPNPAYSQTQNQLQYDLRDRLQLQLQITQQIQQQIEQLQKLQELQRQSINQQKKIIDEGKLDLEKGSTSQGRQPIYQQAEQTNRQRLQTDSQEIYTQHSLLPQSTTANLQFASPVNAIQKPPSRFVSSLFLDNVTDPSLPYYLVAPALNSVSFYDRLPNGGLEGRAFLPHTLVDLTTSVPNLATATPSGVFGESVSTATPSEVHTPTEVPYSDESTERSGVESETATAQRRTQPEVTTILPREARERLQNSIRRFVSRGQRT